MSVRGATLQPRGEPPLHVPGRRGPRALPSGVFSAYEVHDRTARYRPVADSRGLVNGGGTVGSGGAAGSASIVSGGICPWSQARSDSVRPSLCWPRVAPAADTDSRSLPRVRRAGEARCGSPFMAIPGGRGGTRRSRKKKAHGTSLPMDRSGPAARLEQGTSFTASLLRPPYKTAVIHLCGVRVKMGNRAAPGPVRGPPSPEADAGLPRGVAVTLERRQCRPHPLF